MKIVSARKLLAARLSALQALQAQCEHEYGACVWCLMEAENAG